MEKKLSKHGNSRAMVLDKPILDLVSANDDTVFKISVEGKKIILEAKTKKKMKVSNDKKMQRMYEEIVEKYGPALKKLSKN